jgi:nucleoside-diphosphate-sugar epimerase
MSLTQPQRVLITGATGFIGGRLCEVMALTGAFEPRAFVHSTASAGRITRFPLDFVVGDLCDRKSVDCAMRGCDAVVHLARGHKAVMLKGLENVLQSAVDHNVSRFVHMSSVAVFGDQPSPEAVSEEAATHWTESVYGNEKLAQEHRVLKYWKRYGLPSVILRPSNIYGPFAPFTLNLLERIRSKRIAIVDEGRNPSNVVYIDNVVEAILLALWKPGAVGQIFFVTDSEVVSWHRCISDHAALLGVSVPCVATDELNSTLRKHIIRDSLRVLPRVLLCGELRAILRQIPVFNWVDSVLYDWFLSLSKEMQQKIRLGVNGPTIVRQKGFSPHCFHASDNLIAAQARTVAHSSDKARQLLGYTAPVSYRQGMALTAAWLRYAHIIPRFE